MIEWPKVRPTIRPGASHMAAVLLFHHALGLTPGVRAFADDLRSAGHVVHTPDLFHGRTFQSLDEGLAYISKIGFDTMRERGVRVADELKHVPAKWNPVRRQGHAANVESTAFPT